MMLDRFRSRKRRMHDIRITNNEAHGKGCHVWIDGREIHYVTSVSTKVSVNDANRVTIELIAGSINAK